MENNDSDSATPNKSKPIYLLYSVRIQFSGLLREYVQLNYIGKGQKMDRNVCADAMIHLNEK